MKACEDKKSLLGIHTTSRCCSPLISIASRLRIEHGNAGKVTSNCMLGKQGIGTSLAKKNKSVKNLKVEPQSCDAECNPNFKPKRTKKLHYIDA